MSRVIGAAGVKVFITNVNSGRKRNDKYWDEFPWTVIVEQEERGDIVLAWYKTRAEAREYKRRVDTSLKSFL